MFKYAYLVSGHGRLLQTVINAASLCNLPFEITVVICDRENGAAERAKKAGIPQATIDHKAFPDRNEFDRALLQTAQDAGADALILNFDRLIGQTLLSQYPGRILNTHFSLLPLFPGFNAIDNAVESGMRFAGVTVHLVDETVDGGAIVGQAAIPVEPGDTSAMLGTRLFKAAVPLQMQAMSMLAENRLQQDEQGAIHIAGAHYQPGSFSPNLEAPFDELPEAALDGITFL